MASEEEQKTKNQCYKGDMGDRENKKKTGGGEEMKRRKGGVEEVKKRRRGGERGGEKERNEEGLKERKERHFNADTTRKGPLTFFVWLRYINMEIDCKVFPTPISSPAERKNGELIYKMLIKDARILPKMPLILLS